MRITDILVERFVNLLGDDPEKDKYVDVVWDMITKSYARIGGIQGKGFSTKEDLINNIPFWKLVRKDGDIVAGAFYRDKAGRKRVAVATNGTDTGKVALASIMANDFDRAYFEVSDPSLGFMVKQVGLDFVQGYARSVEQAQQISGDELQAPPADDPHVVKYPSLANNFYQRDIGGHMHTKIMLGTTGNKIVVSD
jgi:hypothetical protein